jgi:hypothetical protein
MKLHGAQLTAMLPPSASRRESPSSIVCGQLADATGPNSRDIRLPGEEQHHGWSVA